MSSEQILAALKALVAAGENPGKVLPAPADLARPEQRPGRYLVQGHGYGGEEPAKNRHGILRTERAPLPAASRPVDRAAPLHRWPA